MGIYGALSTAVTGLRAQSHALENISGNIANSQTVGYKRIDTSFKDLIADAPVRAQIPGAVLAQSQSTNNQQGDIQTSSNETYIALNGNGFFVVEPKIGQADGSPLFAGTNNFTRRGDFEIDKDGLLVNGAGYYLKGFPIDTATGNISGSVPSVISISNAYLPANVTRLINYQANLPQVPKTANYNAASPNSELMKTWSYTGVSGSPAYPRTTNGATISDFATSVPARAVGAQTYVGTAAANTIANDGDLLAVTMHGATYNLLFAPTGTTPGVGEILIDNTGTVADVVGRIQTALRTATGEPTVSAQLRHGAMVLSAGDGNTADLTLATTRAAGGAVVGGMLGLGDGTKTAQTGGAVTSATTPGYMAVSHGQSMEINIGGLVRKYTFDAVGGMTAGTGEAIINSSKTLDGMLADIQTDLRANGGPGAADARVAYEGGKVVVSFDSNYLYNVSIAGSAATSLGVNGSFAAATGTLATITADDSAKFISESISGGAITVYADNGAPANVQLRWAKVDSEATGGQDKWQLFYMSNSTAVGGATAWTNVGQDYTFNPNGTLVAPGVTEATISNLTVNGVTIGDVKLRHQENGMSEFADVNGSVSVSTLNQNGYGAGEYLSVAVTDEGRVVATYSNGERLELAQVATAQFNGVNSLKRLDGGVYQATAESGEPIIDLSGSGIIGGALESSNTDISDEFTKLIITQQAYSASTRIVSTADEMLQEVLNMIR
ncbi:flagellar hook-basal body complex protein [Devosia sp. MC521]|uniref:flagellar hook-basal body complex protein n=1 Tax=Devosia sp. MC521 TaxID=2759954 RepID=UPI0015F84E53|nr:flagellar hook-basal body complex protein [Devosia sp. MC521]MBJ6986529.1 flagellar hook-basal body complex protein [Devosia sp. MC521]QMW61575.1 flagellar hook-basal body complex protein [Devosia sp. MC521]